MSIRLDWDVESEQKKIHHKSGEDPEFRRRRWKNRLRLLLIPLILLGIAGVVVGGIIYRLQQVEREIEQVLLATVEAEVAALRLGDVNAFLALQRSASDAWLIAQQSAFDTYQAQKLNGNTQLTGHVVASQIEGSRARVQVQEIIDQTPYVRTWFYWRYDDGWRHVPPDYTFWGAQQTESGDRVTVTYQAVDALLAQTIQREVSGWLVAGCEMLTCAAPSLEISIVPEVDVPVVWDDAASWRLRVPSPYTRLARQDAPFDFSLRFEVAQLIVDRLVTMQTGELPVTYPADAFYLRASIASWLVGRFVGVDTNTFLISSLAAGYSDAAVGQLLAVMQPDSPASVLNQVTGTASLDQAGLDWRDFLTWRLALEGELREREAEAEFIALYDTRDEAVRSVAYQRYTEGAAGPAVILAAVPETTPDGQAQLRAQLEDGAEVIFRLVNGEWLRAN